MLKRVYGVLGMLGLIAAAFPEIADAADCQDWGFGPNYVLRQTNGFTVTLSRITRTGVQFDASAKAGGVGRGDAAGQLQRNGRLKFNIDWDNGSVGIYTAFVQQDDGAVLDGRTYDKVHPESWASWTGDDIPCNDAPEPEPKQ